MYQERISGAKLLQRVSGVRPAVMWGAAFVWDWAWLFLVYLCIVLTLACFQENTLSTPEELGNYSSAECVYKDIKIIYRTGIVNIFF